jgi:hypothetical protein
MSEPATSLLEQMLAEQKKQTGLLQQIATNQVALIQALSDEQGTDPDELPRTYLDGSPCL